MNLKSLFKYGGTRKRRSKKNKSRKRRGGSCSAQKF
jgi:hypothetical protein